MFVEGTGERVGPRVPAFTDASGVDKRAGQTFPCSPPARELGTATVTVLTEAGSPRRCGTLELEISGWLLSARVTEGMALVNGAPMA